VHSFKTGPSQREALERAISCPWCVAARESTLIYAFQTVARGWRTQEPDELEEPTKRGRQERAQRFERLSYRALAEGLISLQKAAELLRLPVPEVEAGLKGPQAAHV
jgi:hypothetical protein